MSIPSFEVPQQCEGCETAQLCKRVIDGLGQEVATEVARVEGYTEEYEATGELPADAEYLLRLADVVEAGAHLLGLETDHTATFMQRCPGTRAAGQCGLSPQTQLAMLPTLVPPTDPHYQKIAHAAQQGGHEGWDPRLN